jgi:hypothetical protein
MAESIEKSRGFTYRGVKFLVYVNGPQLVISARIKRGNMRLFVSSARPYSEELSARDYLNNLNEMIVGDGIILPPDKFQTRLQRELRPFYTGRRK